MWIKLDFTPLFAGALTIGLILIAIGIGLRMTFPKASWIGLTILVIGAIPAFAGGFFLALDQFANWHDKNENRVSSEQLKADRVIQGIRLPRGTTLERRGGHMSGAFLAQPLSILGLPLEAKANFTNTFTNGDLHVATDLETATLAEDRTINGVPCKAHYEIEFFLGRGPDPENGRTPLARVGKLRRCMPSADFDFGGNRYVAGVEVTRNAWDGMEKGTLAADQEVDGHWCKQGTEVQFEDKLAVRFTVARDETVKGIACKSGTQVVIEAGGGHLTSAVLAHDQEIGGVPCRGGEAAVFGYNGGAYPLDSCVLSHPFAIEGVTWPAGSKVRAMTFNWLEVTLPADARPVAIGEVTVAGRCKISMNKAPLVLKDVDVVEGEAGYAELRGARFSELFLYEGSGYGVLAEAGTVDGFAYAAGEKARVHLTGAKDQR